MKTSNKLLIALAISLIIIPIVVIAINVKMNYRDKNTFFKHLKENKNFNTPLEGFETKEIPTFSAININNGNDAHINFNIIKSNKSGIKIPVDLMQVYDFNVDDKQILQIKLKQNPKKLTYSVTIYVYTNDVNLLTIEKANGFTLDISTDSLTMIAKNVDRLSFEENSNVRSLKLVTEKVKELNFFDSKGIKNIDLELSESNFHTFRSIYQSLKISSFGNSNIEIDGDKAEKDKYFIEDLKINTNGKSTVTLSDIKVNKISGSLSDSTNVVMPAISLKQMLKN
ncbi:hypothetical protein [Pedobacter jamesrossensis]|uniref:Auto-transporter adhesin head GIN domain-containing protein n=1 Tax=Pedobacter jamesrossensis TaxID=1908238 RepID=A0ABV8NTW0_9SPHI